MITIAGCTIACLKLCSSQHNIQNFSLLLRVLNVQVLGSRQEEECSSVGREQVNKAYQAYREACIDRDHLKSRLEKMVCLLKE